MSSELLQFLPQTGPARLIVEVLELQEEHTLCLARVPQRSPFRSCATQAGSLPITLAVEMAAQAAALAEPSPTGDGPSSCAGPRLLVGARDVSFHAAALSAESTFRVLTRRTTLAPPLRVYRFELFEGETLVAEGELSTFYEAG